MRKLCYLICLMLMFQLTNGQMSSEPYFYSPIRVTNPRTWKSDNGKITESKLTVRPKGLYSQIDLELTFAAHKPHIFVDDTLEITFSFNLPEHSFVTDSWLWVNGVPERAKLLDLSLASATYENIVNRRKDPSLLTTYGGNNYNLSIYPMMPLESRKVKITYMVLNQWSKEEIKVPLPLNILGGAYGMDKVFSKKVDIELINTNRWENVRLSQKTNAQNYVERQAYVFGFVPEDEFNLVFDSPLKNGIYSRKFEVGGQGYFEMAFMPEDILDFSSSGTFTHFDLHTGLTNGITFDKSYFDSEIVNPKSDEVILQTGSYKGTGDLRITAAGELHKNIYSKASTINTISSTDTTIKKIWVNQKIQRLSSELNGGYYWYYGSGGDTGKYNRIQKEIVKLSLENRILCNHTAFLALEPGMQLCYSCVQNTNWGGVPVSNASMVASDVRLPYASYSGVNGNNFSLTVNSFNVKTEGEGNLRLENVLLFPNPSTDYIRILLSGENIDSKQYKVIVSDSYGKEIKTMVSNAPGNFITIDFRENKLLPGLYTASVFEVGGSLLQTKKFIVK